MNGSAPSSSFLMPPGQVVEPSPENELANAVEATVTAWQDVQRLGLVELLEHDARPSFIVDLKAVNIAKNAWGRVYINPAYKSIPRGLTYINFDENNGTAKFLGPEEVQGWTFGPPGSLPDLKPLIVTDRYIASRVTLQGRWRIVQLLHRQESTDEGTTALSATTKPVAIPTRDDAIHTARPASKSPGSALGAEMSRSASGAKSPRLNPVEGVHNHPFLKSADWSQSPIGPPEHWPGWMKAAIGTILADKDPSLVVWKDRAIIYNELVVPLISQKHPSALGNDGAVAFEEFWPSLSPLIDSVKANYKAKSIDGMCLPMARRGFLEETYWNFTLLPLYNEHGRCEAVLNRFSEVTSTVIAARRLAQVTTIGERTSEARDVEEMWTILPEIMATHHTDTPFMMLFSVEDEKGRISAPKAEDTAFDGLHCHLKGKVAIPAQLEEAVKSFPITGSDSFLAPLVRRAFSDNKPMILKAFEGLPEELQFEVEGRGWGDKVTAVVLLPIMPDGQPVALMVKALNPRRPYDTEFVAYMRLITRRLVDAFAHVFLPLEERRYRAEVEQAAMEQANLAQQLMVRAKEAEDSAAAFSRLASEAPIGMFLYSAEGIPLYINDYYLEITGLQREDFDQFAWLESVHQDDWERLEVYRHELYDKKMPVTFEYRLKRPWITTAQDGTQVEAERWVLTSAFPQTDDDGNIINTVGWLIDISSQKWAELIQKERLKDALESRAQAHRFIDMVSHECRNPLSAILQSADGIVSSISIVDKPSEAKPAILKDAIEAIQDSAQTIILCAQHQKRIVDDILTVSKLDGKHLIITPDKADPVALVQHVLRMYEAELDSDSIKTEVLVLPEYKELGIEYVLLDPSRTLQVLINLVTNAIKFTAPSKKRTITISLNASKRRPSEGLYSTSLVPQRTAKLSPMTSHPEWSNGKDLYIQFSVNDTGRGMSPDEMEKLFERFTQASPRTHVKYGGSGLGLFISRQLTELQGGQIGVSSKLGLGSTFAFYIMARQSADPAKAAQTPLYTPGPASSESSQSSSFPFPKVSVPAPTSVPAKFRPDGVSPATTPTPANPAPKAPAASEPIHVLIVEDNLINQKVMAKQLQKLGCEVNVANHGVEALDFIKHSVYAVFPPYLCSNEDHQLDVILMDIEMPVMDGMACVREIRAMERRGEINGHIPVIAVTANARDGQQHDAIEQGMDQVVTKPFRIPELVPKMKSLVESQKAAKK